MGSNYSQRIQRQIISRRRTQFTPTKVEADNDRTTSGNTGDNKTSEEASYRQVMARHNERGVGKTK